MGDQDYDSAEAEQDCDDVLCLQSGAAKDEYLKGDGHERNGGFKDRGHAGRNGDLSPEQRSIGDDEEEKSKQADVAPLLQSWARSPAEARETIEQDTGQEEPCARTEPGRGGEDRDADGEER